MDKPKSQGQNINISAWFVRLTFKTQDPPCSLSDHWWWHRTGEERKGSMEEEEKTPGVESGPEPSSTPHPSPPQGCLGTCSETRARVWASELLALTVPSLAHPGSHYNKFPIRTELWWSQAETPLWAGGGVVQSLSSIWSEWIINSSSNRADLPGKAEQNNGVHPACTWCAGVRSDLPENDILLFWMST